jgi:hypothetical protein
MFWGYGKLSEAEKGVFPERDRLLEIVKKANNQDCGVAKLTVKICNTR